MQAFWKYGPLLSAHTKTLINFNKSKIQEVHVLHTSGKTFQLRHFLKSGFPWTLITFPDTQCARYICLHVASFYGKCRYINRYTGIPHMDPMGFGHLDNNSHEAGCNGVINHDMIYSWLGDSFHRSFCKTTWIIYRNTTCQHFFDLNILKSTGLCWLKKNIPPAQWKSFVCRPSFQFSHVSTKTACNIMRHTSWAPWTLNCTTLAAPAICGWSDFSEMFGGGCRRHVLSLLILFANSVLYTPEV